MAALPISFVQQPVFSCSHSESDSVDSDASNSEVSISDIHSSDKEILCIFVLKLRPSCNCSATCQRKSKYPCKGSSQLIFHQKR